MIIKLFEEFGDDSQFHKISDNEYFSSTSSDLLIPFTDKEKEELSKFSKDGSVQLYRRNRYYHLRLSLYLMRNDSDLTGMYIHKTNDDWYYMSVNGELYKCDEFKGLIDCIKSC